MNVLVFLVYFLWGDPTIEDQQLPCCFINFTECKIQSLDSDSSDSEG